MDKALMFDLVKEYIKGSLSIQLESEFGQAYQKGVRSIDEYIKSLEKSNEISKKVA